MVDSDIDVAYVFAAFVALLAYAIMCGVALAAAAQCDVVVACFVVALMMFVFLHRHAELRKRCPPTGFKSHANSGRHRDSPRGGRGSDRGVHSDRGMHIDGCVWVGNAFVYIQRG